MKHSLKSILLISVATAYAPAVAAQTSSSLENRVQALEALVLRLESQLAAEKAETDNDLIVLEKRATDIIVSKVPEKSGSGFKVGDTTFKLGGFVDTDVHVTNFSDTPPASASAGRDFHIPFTTNVGDGTGGATVTDFTAQATRFSVSVEREISGKKATAHIETDFLVTGQGNERITNSFSPRLRRAYLDYNGFRVGQEWSTFQNTSAIPESASFFVLTEGQVFIRQPIIRYTNGNFQIAAENGNATVIPALGASPLGIEEDSNLIPDVIARYNLKGDYGNISLSAIGRQLRSNSPGLDAESDFGWGLSAAGRLNLGDGDLRFSVTGGEGLGRYIGLNTVAGAAIDPLTGDVDAIGSIGGHIAYRHPITDNTRFSLGVSQLSIDNQDFALGSITDRARSAYASLFWDPIPKITFGIEGLYGERRTEDGTDGDLSRFTFSGKYGF